MDDRSWQVARFEESRERLRAMAYRMLGSASEAEDAVQESWLRFQSVDRASLENVGGWLTTVVARVCLDALRARKTRRDAIDEPEPAAPASPEADALLADSVGLAMLVVLDTLEPAERTAFVLHDMFDLRFDEIARIVGRTPAAARQLASRGRRRVRGASTASLAPDRAARQRVVDAFLAAARGADFGALLRVLDPDVVLRADALAVTTAAANHAEGAPGLAAEVRGAHAVAKVFEGRARGARGALLDGVPGAVWAQDGRTRAAFVLHVAGGVIASIDVVMEPGSLGEIEVDLLG